MILMGGIKIPSDSRRNIKRKLEELEEQKNNGFITLEEYDTLRIRYERKLGNREAVAQLQKNMGFNSSHIAEQSAKKEELYDDFVDKYSKQDFEDFNVKNARKSGGNSKLLLTIVLLAFIIGIVAGVAALTINSVNETVTSENITVADTAFGSNATMAANTTTTSKSSKTSYSSRKSKSSYSSSSSKRSSSDSSSSGSSDSSGSGSNSGSSSKYSSSGSGSSSSNSY